MVAACMSADALRLFQLRAQLAHARAKEQQLAKLADFQEAALQDTLDNVATLEGHNLQLKQSLLASLWILKAKIGDKAMVLESEQGSDQAAETQTAESKSRGSSDTVEWPEDATTVLIRNMPPRSTIDELLKAFPPDGTYDLMNLPFSIKARRTSSFATINFVSVDLAQAFCERFNGQRLPHSTRNCKSPLRVGPANIQGLEANLLFLAGENGVSETRNPALLPRLYLCSAAAERLRVAGPHCVKQPDELGQPHRLDFRTVLSLLNTA